MVIRIVGALLCVASFGLALFVRFSNPGMTETDLFINLWPSALGIVVMCTLGLFLLRLPRIG